MPDATITIRVDATTLDRLDAVAAAMTKAAHGAAVKRGTAARTVLEAGLAALERRTGIDQKQRNPKK